MEDKKIKSKKIIYVIIAVCIIAILVSCILFICMRRHTYKSIPWDQLSASSTRSDVHNLYGEPDLAENDEKDVDFERFLEVEFLGMTGLVDCEYDNKDRIKGIFWTYFLPEEQGLNDAEKKIQDYLTQRYGKSKEGATNEWWDSAGNNIKLFKFESDRVSTGEACIELFYIFKS